MRTLPSALPTTRVIHLKNGAKKRLAQAKDLLLYKLYTAKVKAKNKHLCQE